MNLISETSAWMHEISVPIEACMVLIASFTDGGVLFIRCKDLVIAIH